MKKTKMLERDLGIIQTSNKFNLFLAPMAGYTDLPFRLLAQNYGADYTTSEMVSAKGIYYKDIKTFDLLKTSSDEKNFGIQIFGSDPDILTKVVNDLENKRKNGDLSYNFLDFNTGCPAPKIVKNGDGSALLKDLNLMGKCIRAIKKEVSVPFSVKTRLGFYQNENNGIEIAKVIEDNGADRIILHPRSREQYYSGEADWKSATKILNEINIPLVLSGDINSPEKAKIAVELGFHNLMIGRAAIENPLIFKQIKDYLRFGDYNKITINDKIHFALNHLNLARRFNDSNHLIVSLRKQLAAYTKGLPNATFLRNEIFKATESEEVVNLFKSIEEKNEIISNYS